MRSEVGRHHNVALLQRGDEFLPKVGEEQFTVCGSVDDHRRGQAIVTQRRDERGRLPMAVRHFSDESLPTTQPWKDRSQPLAAWQVVRRAER